MKKSANADLPSRASASSESPLIRKFAAHLATRASGHTRSAYLRDTQQLDALGRAASPPVALDRITGAQLRRFLAILHSRGLSGRTLARMLSSWRAFFHYLAEEGKVAADPCGGIRPPKSPKRLPNALSPDEASRLVALHDGSPLAVRDRAILELFYSSGLRLSELSGLTLDRVDLRSGEVRVWGKGAKERIVPVGSAAITALDAWLKHRTAIAPKSDALFVTLNGQPISPRTIQSRIRDWAIRQGLPRHVHPHMLRHSFASHVLQSSGDLRAVQEMLGHASITSTQVYTHLDFQYLSKVYDAAHPRARKKRKLRHGA
jgi:integrase/recombinase XerC